MSNAHLLKPTFGNHMRENAIFYALLLLGTFIMIGPFVWMMSTALKVPGDQFDQRLIPQEITLDNFSNAWQLMEFRHLVWNSFKIAALSTIGQLITCSMGAFVFAVVKFRGREALFVLLLATLMIPAQMTVIPQFLIFRWLGLYGTAAPLYLPAFLGGAFGVFLLRQYFRTIPMDLMDAARLDGASLLSIWWRIYLPLARPALAALAIFAFMSSWNDLFTALIYLPSDLEKTTLPVGLSLFQRLYRAEWTIMMAAVLISVTPIMIAFFFVQRQFIAGIAMTGVK
ncbi:carbohydrate ABC transporter membrane protein 2, CUT1 family [Octadecabacter temperatus]|uniref:L-arabinose transport system permease protein AraQ n=1 Tax=Octadecabacter temperatus TaxID=1458307 RepID=A0A0K0Y7Y4_9RHOB|nr:carbohydrate ABC transporter permease [Octadecabacter temperatus]AKS47084.1 L-arabinose transport system permease protein AraQ [Octadecabacter temperatus]SIO46670.1 carbohydrate ABC transporter membrane protein 2, CUT1 family [Octadecabacter temperatus]